MKQWAPRRTRRRPAAAARGRLDRDRRVGYRAELVSGADRRQNAARRHALQRLEPPAELSGARDSASRRRSRAGCRHRAATFPHRAATDAWPRRTAAGAAAGPQPRRSRTSRRPARARRWSASGRPWRRQGRAKRRAGWKECSVCAALVSPRSDRCVRLLSGDAGGRAFGGRGAAGFRGAVARLRWNGGTHRWVKEKGVRTRAKPAAYALVGDARASPGCEASLARRARTLDRELVRPAQKRAIARRDHTGNGTQRVGRRAC